jgi:hypothetical protein
MLTPSPELLISDVAVELVGGHTFGNSTAAAAACVSPATLCTKAELANHSHYKGCCCQPGWCTDFVGYWAEATIKGVRSTAPFHPHIFPYPIS